MNALQKTALGELCCAQFLSPAHWYVGLATAEIATVASRSKMRQAEPC